jgi:hypothetical protein
MGALTTPLSDSESLEDSLALVLASRARGVFFWSSSSEEKSDELSLFFLVVLCY